MHFIASKFKYLSFFNQKRGHPPTTLMLLHIEGQTLFKKINVITLHNLLNYDLPVYFPFPPVKQTLIHSLLNLFLRFHYLLHFLAVGLNHYFLFSSLSSYLKLKSFHALYFAIFPVHILKTFWMRIFKKNKNV